MGAGIHGGFGNTKYSRNSVPVKTARDVIYNQAKTEGYLLNENHPVGGSKARFMREVLGYTQSDAVAFHNSVVDAITGEKPFVSESTPYGLKHTFHVKIAGKDGTSISANVVVVIQQDNGNTRYRIITVYPDKKGK